MYNKLVNSKLDLNQRGLEEQIIQSKKVAGSWCLARGPLNKDAVARWFSE